MNSNEILKTKHKNAFIKLGFHNVLALVTLIAIGSATRIMEAGLACPDWPLCYGTFLPLKHMNLRVFLEWFHRLDAFFVGTLILAQFSLSIIWRKNLPSWLPKIYSFLVFLIITQGTLGALTVINILDPNTVMLHLILAFSILITSIFINQNLEKKLLMPHKKLWWKIILYIPLTLTLTQSIIGVRLSSTWSAHLCLFNNQQCLILNSHKFFAIPVAFSILLVILISLFKENLFLLNWKLLTSLFFLTALQISIGFLSLKTNLNQPLLLITHQIIASLLIAILSTLLFRVENQKEFYLRKDNVILGFN